MVGRLKAKHDELAKSKLPAAEVAKLLEAGAFLVDLRPKISAKLGMARGATNISVFTLKRRLHELPRDRKIVLSCHSGAAEKTRQMLDALGFEAFNGGGYEDILIASGNSRRWSRGTRPRARPSRAGVAVRTRAGLATSPEAFVPSSPASLRHAADGGRGQLVHDGAHAERLDAAGRGVPVRAGVDDEAALDGEVVTGQVEARARRPGRSSA